MRRLNNKGRISLLELVIIIVLIIEGFFLLGKAFGWTADKATGGDDRLLVNTAESTAAVNSLNGMCCPVSNCGSSGECVHKMAGWYVGYYDDLTHNIVAYPPKGYNQNQEMRIKNKKYYGDPGTMVVQIKCKEGVVELDWVKGK
ncbi:MAG: hypothetical protein IK151_05540 [Erysipelotrichaceae bacterium]|nr:hypothetical protein [Erysipelotrichaceae bacterium]